MICLRHGFAVALALPVANTFAFAGDGRLIGFTRTDQHAIPRTVALAGSESADEYP